MFDNRTNIPAVCRISYMAISIIDFRVAHLLFILLMVLGPAAQAEKFTKIASWPGYTRGESYDLQVTNGIAYVAMSSGG